MEISNYYITTSSGKMSEKLPFLTKKQQKEFNTIGYTGKNEKGDRTCYADFLNSLNNGTYKVDQLVWDNGTFTEEFNITRVTS